jgi:hypothetical protein
MSSKMKRLGMPRGTANSRVAQTIASSPVTAVSTYERYWMYASLSYVK